MRAVLLLGVALALAAPATRADVDAGPLPDPRAPVEDDAEPAPVDAPAIEEDVPAVDAGPPPPPVPDEGDVPARDDVAPMDAPDPGARPDDRAPRRDPRDVVDEASPPPPPPRTPPEERGRFGFGGIPALNYDADNGFGAGVLGTLYWLDGTAPYRWALTLQLFFTSKLLTDDFVQLDAVDVMDLPLRVIAKVGYLQTATQNYCGLGAGATCAVDDAERAAAGLFGAARERFVRAYHQVRFLAPNASLQARWAFTKKPAQLSVFGGWRGMLYVPGTFLDEDGDGGPDFFPYPGSLYARAFPQGEPGLASVLQLGVMLDGRDEEPQPTRGFWVEASVRGATPYWGSTWTWGAFNTTLRGYVPLDVDRELVLAVRLMMEAVVGDPPIMELARVGGSQDFYAFGGSEMGRGIRAQRVLGKAKLFDQTELRWTPVRFEAFDQRFDVGTGAFFDAGLVGEDLPDLGSHAGRVLLGFGAMGRLGWNDNFVLRFDVATSPVEDWAISPYLLVNHLF